MSSLYHLNRPTMVGEVGQAIDQTPVAAVAHNLKSRMIKGFDLKPADDFLEARKVMLFNNDLNVSLAAPRASMTDYFYKNADADELLFVHEGSGVLHTLLGDLPFGPLDYLIVPRGIIYQIEFTSERPPLIVDRSVRSSPSLPESFRSAIGAAHTVNATFASQNDWTRGTKRGFPTDMEEPIPPVLRCILRCVGWDGYNYPYAFNAEDFSPRPRTSPPIHQT